MYAIIETGGKQYRVQENDFLFIEKLEVVEGEEVVFDKVLMVEGKIGNPLVEGAKVVAKVVSQGKAPKIIVYNLFLLVFFKEKCSLNILSPSFIFSINSGLLE